VRPLQRPASDSGRDAGSGGAPNRAPAWEAAARPIAIAQLVGVAAPSTAHRVLVRCRVNRLSQMDRATGEPVRRYEHSAPGQLLHVDVTKLGNIPDGGG